MGDWLQETNSEIFKNVEFNFANTSEYAYRASDGSLVKNSIIYKQGVWKREKE